jgi:LPXTG-site transpeptidase (sortase) family protein
MVKKVPSKIVLVFIPRLIFVIIVLLGIFFTTPHPIFAEPNLTITPITWNIMGLDSNNVNVGPNVFPVGARVCNIGTTNATNVVSSFVWDTSDPYINLRTGSLSSYTGDLAVASLEAGDCTDFYYEVEITRNSAAYKHTRGYHVTAAAKTLGEVSTTIPREIYIERLISQNRNSTNLVTLDGISKPAGSTMTLQIGQTYTIRLEASTATQGYNQLEDFISFPNTIFQILDVQTTYTANNSTYVANANDKLYADACLWDNNPASPTYRACVGSDGKAGGSIVNTYTIKVIDGVGTTQTLNTLIYDFSGSSFHYNSDYSSSARFASIVSPLSMTKSFSPSILTTAGTLSTLSINIINSSSSDVLGVSITDVFPTSPGAMEVAGTPSYGTSSGCLPSPAFFAASGDTSITYTGGVKANSTCTISVNVTVSVDGTYVNTTEPLLINGSDTDITASASLTRSTSNPGTSCSTKTMAYWNMNNATATSHQTDVTTYTATLGIPANGLFSTPSPQSPGSGGNAWETWGYLKNTFNATTSQYYQFAIDTSKYTKVKLDFSVMSNGGGPTDLYVFYGTNSSPATQTSKIQTTGAISTTWSTKSLDFTSDPISTSGITYFRIYGFQANNAQSGANLYLDDVTFTGESCTSYSQPTIDKNFSPATILAGETSALTFTLHNTNSNPLTNVSFSDVLPEGMTVTKNPSSPYNTSSTSCSNAIFSPAEGDTTLSFSGATIDASSTCTATVYVTVDRGKTYNNTSGYISSSQTGINTTDGTASSSLVANLLPPEIQKIFSPNPVVVNGTSVLTFTITNPNSADALTGVGFTDIMPNENLVAGAPTTTCIDGVLDSSTSTTIVLSGASIPAGGACTVSVPTSSAITGSYLNTSSNVFADIVGNGNTASDTLVVNPITPDLSILKQISTSASGPWASKLNVAVNDDIYYRFTIENIGDVNLSPVWVTDPDISTSSCSWPAVLPVGSQTADPTASCIVGPIKAISGVHPNTAYASGSYNNLNYDSLESTATYSTTALSLEKSSSTPSYSDLYDVINYSYSITNTGAASLPGPVRVFDTNTTVTCPAVNTIGDLDSNLDQNETIVCSGSYLVTATDLSVGSVTNSAFATAGSVTSNTERAVVYENKPDLVVEKTNNTSNGYATINSPFIWTLTISNVGPVTAYFDSLDRIVTDTLPTGPTYGSPTVDVTGITGNVSCSLVGQTLDCSANGGVSIAKDQSFSVNISVTPVSLSTLNNTTSVDPENQIDEGNEGNNNGTDSVAVQAPLPDLKLVKSNNVTADTIAINNSFTWTLTVSNVGGNAANFASGDRVIGDTLPLGVTYGTVSSSSTSLNCSVNNEVSPKILTCLAVGSLTIDIDQSFTVQVDATPNIAGDISNTATVDPDHKIADGNTGNNTDIDTVTVESSDLTVTKTNSTGDDKGMQNIPFDWTITVNNIGPVEAAFTAGQTLLRDELPVDATYPGSVSVSSLVSVTGTVICTIEDELISSVTTKVISCKADSGGASLGASTGSFKVVISVTPTSSGTLSNTATADPDAVLVESDEDNNVDTNSLLIASNTPAINVLKKTTTTSIYAAGQVIPYEFVVTNTGSVTLTDITIEDVKCDNEESPTYASGDNGDSQLQIGETWIYTCDHVVTSQEFSSGTNLSNTVTVDSTESEPATDSLDIPLAIVHVKKTADTSVITSSGQSVKYTFTLTNKGTMPLTNITVGDLTCDTYPEYVSGDTSNLTVLDLSETWVFSCLRTISTDEFTGGVDISNTVTVDSDESAAVTDTVQLPIASLNVEKASSTTLIKSVGQVVPYTFEITNTGSKSLTTVSVVDALCSSSPVYSSGDNADFGALNLGETWIYTCSHTVTSAELHANAVLSNTVTVDSAESPSDTDTLTISVASITVNKTSSTVSVVEKDQVVPYQFTVKNTGTVPLADVRVDDPNCDGLITGPAGDSNSDSILQTSETWQFSCNHTVSQSEINAGGNLSNTVTVTTNQSNLATDSLDIPVVQSPAIHIEKTSTTELIATIGQVVPYRLLVTNVGNIPLSAIIVSDPNCEPEPVYQSGDSNSDGLLQLSESWLYTCSHIVTSTEINELTNLSNTATADSEEADPDTSTINIQISKDPIVGIAKRVIGTPSKVTGKPGVWSITFEFLVKNYGNIPLTEIQITDNLSTTFSDNPVRNPATSFIVTDLSSDDFSVNWPGYTGLDEANSDLLLGTDNLEVGGEGKVLLTLELTPASEGSFENSAIASAIGNELTVSDTSTDGTDPDFPNPDGDPTNNSSTTGTTFSANIFDPPHGTKVFDDSGLPALQWTMEWINDTNITAVAAEVYDPIPEGTTYLLFGPASGTGVPSDAPLGSTDIGVSCTDSSVITTTEWCYFEGGTSSYPRGRIIWKGVLGPDLGVSDPTIAVNDLQIQFYVNVAAGIKGVENIATINSDLNGDGDVEDSGETTVASADKIWGTLDTDSNPSLTPTVKSKLPDTGFAPFTSTYLIPQPLYSAYSSTAGLTIQIPRLGINTTILGVPQNSETGEWDVSWLSSQVGWLNGTAYPTSSGNSLITAHVYLANGKPGPFVDLGTMKWGDQIIIHSMGMKYVYDVREVISVLPGNQAVFKHKDKAWLTLVTCQGYNEKTNQYVWRKVVKAVLVSVSKE